MDFTDLLEKVLEVEPYSNWKQVSSKSGEEKYRDYSDKNNPALELSRFGLYCYKEQRVIKSLISLARDIGLGSHIGVPSKKAAEQHKKQTAIDEKREKENARIKRWLGKDRSVSEKSRKAAKQRWCGKDFVILQKYFCDVRGLKREWLTSKFLYRELEAYVVSYQRKDAAEGDQVTEIRLPMRDVDGNLVQLMRIEVDAATGERIGRGKTMMFTADRDRAISFGCGSSRKHPAEVDEVVVMEGIENALVFYFCIAKPAQKKNGHTTRMLAIGTRSGLGRIADLLLSPSQSIVLLDNDADSGAVIASAGLEQKAQRFLEAEAASLDNKAPDILDSWLNDGRKGVEEWFRGLRFVGLEEVLEITAEIKDKELREVRAEPLKYARMRKPWTDAGAARVFLDNFTETVKVTEDGRWWVWSAGHGGGSGGIWSSERAEGQVREWIASLSVLYSRIAKTEYAEGSDGREKCEAMATSLCNASRQSSVMKLIHGAGVIACKVEDFDANPGIINLLNGVLELSCGELHKAEPRWMCSRQAGMNWNVGAECSRFDAFLAEIMSEDSALISYKLRQLAYLLSGKTNERCLFFHLGSGGNGKSVEADLLLKLLGDYATTINNDLLLERRGQSFSSEESYELARLPGVRLAICSETDENRAWSETGVKRLTGGGDKLIARAIKKSPFSFNPQFRVIVHGNNYPKIKSGDEAFWGRIHIVPYELELEKAKQDAGLIDALWKERDGILQRIYLEGYASVSGWSQLGLAPPERVLLAKQDYKASIAGDIEEFIAIGCIRDEMAETKASELYAEYVRFCERTLKIRPKTQAAFGRVLGQHGFASRKSHGIIIREGIKLGDFDAELENSEVSDDDDDLIH